MKPRRIACLVILRFSVEVCLRARPALAGRPLAIAQGDLRREIVGTSRDAAGVNIGMTPKQARAACLGLVVLARDCAAELGAMREVLDALETCGPDVEGAAPGMCYFDATQLPAGETQALGRALALVAALGFTCAAAIADDKFTAKCAALVAGGGVSIVPAGGSAAFLAPLPVGLLPLAPGDGDRFDLLGLRTLGQIAALPTGPLSLRFGERARGYAKLARGGDDEPLQPRHETVVHEDRFAFDEAVDNVEPVLFALRGCIANVAARLAGRAQTCDRVEIVLNADTLIPVILAEPTSSAENIFHLARIALESREMLESIAVITVRAAPCGQAPPQLSLFDGSASSRRAALAATLARLRAALDPQDIVMLTPTPARSRLPERMQQATPIASPQDLTQLKCSAGALAPENKPWAPALRLVDPPKPMTAPEQQAWCAGPFRLSESWWERPIERDYYQMTDPAGALLLVFQDARDGNWYLQGVFD
ncbi:MAG TPA: DNA polymerase Y family protein [Candidatus Tumulicola sp.]|nr:DNA polymerase Y family protein [Candidatus Tumulicola sp.]